MNNQEISIYTDGSCKGNGKDTMNPGGWSFVFKTSETSIPKSFSGHDVSTTNNRMELTAIIEACEYYEKNLRKDFPKLAIYTDSAYCYNCYIQKWYEKWLVNDWTNSKKEKVKNKDLWVVLIPYFTQDHITFHKVKGHSTSALNSIADRMAQVEAKNAGGKENG